MFRTDEVTGDFATVANVSGRLRLQTKVYINWLLNCYLKSRNEQVPKYASTMGS